MGEVTTDSMETRLGEIETDSTFFRAVREAGAKGESRASLFGHMLRSEDNVIFLLAKVRELMGSGGRVLEETAGAEQ